MSHLSFYGFFCDAKDNVHASLVLLIGDNKQNSRNVINKTYMHAMYNTGCSLNYINYIVLLEHTKGHMPGIISRTAQKRHLHFTCQL
jgi:hypothetical protein